MCGFLYGRDPFTPCIDKLKATDNTKENHTSGETGYNLETGYLKFATYEILH